MESVSYAPSIPRGVRLPPRAPLFLIEHERVVGPPLGVWPTRNVRAGW